MNSKTPKLLQRESGLEKDRRMRAALQRLARPELALSVCQELVDLGFDAPTAWLLVESVITAMSKQIPKGPKRAKPQ